MDTPSSYSMSPSIGALAADLAAAQGKIRTAAKDSQNPHFKSRYADLASVWDACRSQLSEHGIAVIQPTSMEDGRVVVTTLLAHKSGEWVSSSCSARPGKDDPQSVGSVVTYLRRYGLAAMVGVAPGDDDDGEAGMGRHDSPRAPAPPTRPPRGEGHDASWTSDRARFCAKVGDLGMKYDDLVDYLVSEMGKSRPSEMTQAARDGLLGWLAIPANVEKVRAYTAAVTKQEK